MLTRQTAGPVTCRWLVGTSYRVVYRRDPVPAMKHKRKLLLLHGLTHVHGEIYINDDRLAPGKQPELNHIHGDIEDHSLMRYAEVRTLAQCNTVYKLASMEVMRLIMMQ